MNLIFEPEHYPRTMTRVEWLRAYRWVRRTRKELQTNYERTVAAALTCKDERIRRDLLDKLLFPPLLVVPDLPLQPPIDLRPGAINYVRAARNGRIP